MRKSEKKEVTKLSHVMDDATDEVIEVSDDMRHWAFKIHNYMEADAITKAFIWSVFRAQKLYLAFGCSSMKEYADDQSSIGRSTIYSYLDIGDRLFSALKQMKSLTVRLEDGPEEFLKELKADPEIAKLGEVGHRKLREIGKQDDEKIKQLLDQKKMTFDDGTTITYDEIKESTVREIESRLREQRQKDKKTISELKKQEKNYEEKLNKLELANERIKKDADAGKKYKDMFGQESTDFEAYKSRLLTARGKAAELNQALSKITNMPEDFESLVGDLRDLHKQIDRGLRGLRDDNRESGAFAQFSN